MDLNKKLIDQLSDLSRNIKSLTSEVKENKNAVSAENSNSQKESAKEDSGKKESVEDQNKKFLKSLEDIFKKGVGEITKSNTESKGILKDVAGAVKGKGLESALGAISPLKDKALESITSNASIPKGISGLLGKIPKFAAGGVMDKTGLALVGEKGPEVVKLDKGDKVIPNKKLTNRDDINSQLLAFETDDEKRKTDKNARYDEILKMSLEERQKVDPAEYLKATKYAEEKGKSEMKTMDQTLSPPSKKVLTKDSTLEEAKAKLLENDPTYYAMFPEDLEEHAEYELNELKEKRETFTQEDVQKLTNPTNPANPVIPEIPAKEEEISKKEKRRKEKEEKKKSKDLLKPEGKPKADKEGPTLMEKGKGFLKEKGALDKGKNLLFSKGKDLLTGKMSLKDLAKNPASLLGDKSQLMGKGIGAATSLLSNKGLKEKGMEKLKGLKKEKGAEEKSSMSVESPDLKKVKTEPKKEEEKKPEEKKEVKKETSQTESKSSSPEKESPKAESPKAGSESGGKSSSDMGSADMSDIKALLGKMVSLLEGPLSIETMESPFRPDSRRF